MAMSATELGSPSSSGPNLVNLIDDGDVMQMMTCQKNMLDRFEKTNQMLVNCNALASARFDRAARDLKITTHQLEDLKRDLDSIFKRIRMLRSKLTSQFPSAFKACNVSNPLDEEDDEEEDKDGVESNREAEQEMGDKGVTSTTH